MFGTRYSKWSNPIIKGPLIQTTWDQYRYNELVATEHKNYRVPVGCGPLAAAQIMAYHKYPKQCAGLLFKMLIKQYDYAKDWNGLYNWEEILSGTDIGARDLSCLLYEIGKRAFTNYEEDSSGTFSPMLMFAMNQMGYDTPDTTLTSNYSFKNIKSSIDNNAPVFVEGYEKSYYIGLPFWKWVEFGDLDTGHAFVCDGYLSQERTKTTYVFWIPCNSTEKNEYVHLNPGWGSDAKGWYKSGIFDMNNGYIDDLDVGTLTKGTLNENNFSKCIRIWTNIKPKNSD